MSHFVKSVRDVVQQAKLDSNNNGRLSLALLSTTYQQLNKPNNLHAKVYKHIYKHIQKHRITQVGNTLRADNVYILCMFTANVQSCLHQQFNTILANRNCLKNSNTKKRG